MIDCSQDPNLSPQTIITVEKADVNAHWFKRLLRSQTDELISNNNSG